MNVVGVVRVVSVVGVVNEIDVVSEVGVVKVVTEVRSIEYSQWPSGVVTVASQFSWCGW